jgi:membrane protease YdiL (CAAX protease family)
LALTLIAFVLNVQEYYGRPDFYYKAIHGGLERWSKAHPGGLVDTKLYEELYRRSWWGFTRIVGYVFPLLVWRLFFRQDRLLDFGLRGRGFGAHAWIYALCMVVMVPLLLFVSHQPDFVEYYPMYKLAGRSWLDFFVWEAIYLGQFFTLELFFRGFCLRALRTFGSGAIWVMTIPYVMVHYGKPYLEASAAIVAGVVLGSLAMRTRSIYAGFLVHGTVAILMDVLALYRRKSLPALLTPTSTKRLIFPYWTSLIWIAWALAFVVLAVKIWHSREQIRSVFQRLRR